LAGVKGFAFDGGLFADGSLFHTYIQLFTPTIGCKALVEGVSGHGDMGIRGKAGLVGNKVEPVKMNWVR
jgi:hypothetical protein